MDMMEVADPDAVHAVRSFIRKQLASELKAEFISTVCHFLGVTLTIANLYPLNLFITVFPLIRLNFVE